MNKGLAAALGAAFMGVFLGNQNNVNNDRVSDVIKSWDSINQEISATNINTDIDSGMFKFIIEQSYTIDDTFCIRRREQSHFMGVNMKGSGRNTCSPNLALDKLDL